MKIEFWLKGSVVRVNTYIEPNPGLEELLRAMAQGVLAAGGRVEEIDERVVRRPFS